MFEITSMMDIVSEIGLLQLMFIWAVVIFASLLRSFTGFGFALTAVPVFSLLLSPTDAVVLSAALTLCSNLLGVRTYWGVVPLRPMLPLVVMAVIGTVLGTLLLSIISPQQFQIWAGAAVIVACLVLMSYKPSTYRVSPLMTKITGLISGLMNGALAIPGPPMIIYAMLTEPEPERSRALLITFFLVSAAVALVSFGVAGFISEQSFWYLLLAFPAMILGDKLGFYLFQRFGGRLYRRIAITALLAIGVTISLRAIL
jgi:uncharacterized membrane protein YfcA